MTYSEILKKVREECDMSRVENEIIKINALAVDF